MRRNVKRHCAAGAIVLMMTLALGELTACSLSGNQAETPSANQAAYAVVSIDENESVEELFNFDSTSQISVTSIGTPMEEGVYTIGNISGGGSVVWRSGDDNYGYDDCLFVYVDDEVDKTSLFQWASKLSEAPITFDEFKERF